MKTLIFHGYLCDMYPDGIQIEGGSPAECISGLRYWPGFRKEDGKQHHVALPDFQSRQAIYDNTDKEEIHIYPVLAGHGGKSGSFLAIAIGVILVVAAPAIWWALPLMSGFTIGTITTAGAMLVLNGVISLLSPAPKSSSDSSSDKKSNYLAATKNTTKVGTRIPMIYGRRKVYGQILSFNVTATNLPEPSAPPVLPPGASSSTADSDGSVSDRYVTPDGTDTHE